MQRTEEQGHEKGEDTGLEKGKEKVTEEGKEKDNDKGKEKSKKRRKKKNKIDFDVKDADAARTVDEPSARRTETAHGKALAWQRRRRSGARRATRKRSRLSERRTGMAHGPRRASGTL